MSITSMFNYDGYLNADPVNRFGRTNLVISPQTIAFDAPYDPNVELLSIASGATMQSTASWAEWTEEDPSTMYVTIKTAGIYKTVLSFLFRDGIPNGPYEIGIFASSTIGIQQRERCGEYAESASPAPVIWDSIVSSVDYVPAGGAIGCGSIISWSPVDISVSSPLLQIMKLA